MAIPFAALTSRVLSGRWWLKVPYVLIVAALVWFNLFQTKQYYNGAINWMGMTKEAYWDSFLRRYPSSEYWDMLRFPDPSMARKGIYYQGDLTLDEILPDKKSDSQKDKQGRPEDERERYIRKTDKFIRNDKAWFQQMQQKAARDGITVDSAIRRDAIWLYEKERKKREPLSSPDMQ
jgi:hypothetical protein